MIKSLRDRIREAATVEQVLELRAEGERYRQASNNTKNKWAKAVKERLDQLKEQERLKGLEGLKKAEGEQVFVSKSEEKRVRAQKGGR